MRSKKISVADMWQDFAPKTMPLVPVGSVQYLESRKVFYGAVAAALFTVRDVAGDPSVSEDEGAEMLAGILIEVQHFFENEVREYNACGKFP